MDLPFVIYILDTETSGLDQNKNSIIELSIFRLNDNVHRTWCLKPHPKDDITADALRINHHKLEDLTWQTAFGRETYREPSKVLPEIENLFLEDGDSPDRRVLVGQNVGFDLLFIKELWSRENSLDTFPFGDRPKIIDTLQLALFLDIVKNEKNQYYNLGNLIKKYGIKNSKTHSASSDTLATKELFLAQCKEVKSKNA